TPLPRRADAAGVRTGAQGARGWAADPGAGPRPRPGRAGRRHALGHGGRRLHPPPDRRAGSGRGRRCRSADRRPRVRPADAPAGGQPARRRGGRRLRAGTGSGARRPGGARPAARALEAVPGARAAGEQARYVRRATDMSLAPSYDPGSFESRLYAEWEASGAFAPRGDGPAYSILLPPPNVTGTLHMGHAFQHTLQDALVRYHRMRGFRTLWQLGSDHAGIATEMVVGRSLAAEGRGESRDSLGREGFIAKVWEWKDRSGDTIERQMRRMGTSGDWSRKVFTMDAGPSRAVVEAFVRLHEQGLVYRGKRLVNWDPVLQTAVSDLEVVSEEEDGHLW